MELGLLEIDATSTTSFWLQLEGGSSLMDFGVCSSRKTCSILLGLAKLNPYGVMVVICCDVGRCDMARQHPPSCDVISLAAWM